MSMDKVIVFNKPYITGKEDHYIQDAIASGKLSGNGKYTRLCQQAFQERYGFHKCLLTTSCTDALEMAAILLGIQPGDEVILPSYTFVSTANAFVLRGAKLVFADSGTENPNIDTGAVEALISPRTKAIIVVHYGGIACDMDKVMDIAERHGILVVEDAAHSINSYFTGKDGRKRALGSIGHLAAFSFHETKNIISGEGGMLVVNDPRFDARAEVIWEKGTNRSAFFRQEVNKYGWVDIGSSFLPSEITAAFLWAQLNELDNIQKRRIERWNLYDKLLSVWAEKEGILLPRIPSYAGNNAHMYYIVCREPEQRTAILERLREQGIMAVFHYQSLHKSPYYKDKHDGRVLANSDHYADCLLRLPMFYELEEAAIKRITDIIIA